jgi:hypothetical protein
MSGAGDAKALTRAMAEAVKHARLAYEFCPGSYTYTTLHACLIAAEVLDQHIKTLKAQPKAAAS